MKKRFYFAILVLFACALCMVGCGTKAEYKADSLTYTIEDRERVQGSFSYTIESGTAIGINYTVVGYDEYGVYTSIVHAFIHQQSILPFSVRLSGTLFQRKKWTAYRLST